MKTIGRKLSPPLRESLLLLPFFLVITLLLAAFRSWDALSFEACAFLRVYDAGRNIFAIIFDPLHTDWGAYQGRELSYLADLTDARFINWCLRHGAVHFYALSGFWLLLLTVFFQQYFIRKLFPWLGSSVTLGVSLLYLLNSSTANYRFFRSAKPGAALALTLVFFLTVQLFRRRRRIAPAEWLLPGGLLLAAALFDRQGYIACAAFTLLLAAGGACCKKADIAFWRHGAVTGAAATLAATAADLLLIPLVIRMLNGYFPDFTYQSVGSCAAGIRLAGAAGMVTGGFGHAFTGTSGWMAAAAGTLLLLFAGYRAYSGRGGVLLTLLLTATVIGMSAVAAVMTARHPAAAAEPYGVYGLIFFTVLLLFLVLVAALERSRRRGRLWLGVLLAGGIILTLLLAPPWRRIADPADMRVRATRQLMMELEGKEIPALTPPLPFPMYKLRQYFSAE